MAVSLITSNDPLLNAQITFGTANRGVMIRELFTNALEAFTGPGESVREIVFMPVKLPGMTGHKLVIANTGKGLDTHTLHAITNLNVSGKQVGLAGRLNRGEGAKIATVPQNPLGLNMLSRANGVTSEVNIIYDKDDRNNREGFGRWRNPAYGYDDVWTRELHQWEADIFEGDCDFTAVTLCGHQENQNTALDPYADGDHNKRFIYEELFYRYYRIDGVTPNNMPVEVTFQGGPWGSGVEFVPIQQFIQANSNKFQTETVALSDGVTVEFIYSPNVNPFHSELCSGRTFAALEWYGEFYSPLAKEWANKIFTMGMHGISKNMSVIIHLPDDYKVTPDRSRLTLLREGNSAVVTCEDFADEICLVLPQWVKDLMQQSVATSGSLADAEKALDRLIDSLRTNAAPNGDIDVTMNGKTSQSKKSKKKTTPPNQSQNSANPNPGPTHTSASGIGGRLKIQRPQLFVIHDESQLTGEYEALRTRCVMYNQSSNQLVLATCHRLFAESLNEITGKLLDEYPILRSATDLNEMVREVLTAAIYQHVSLYIIYMTSDATKGLEDRSTLRELTSVSCLHTSMVHAKHNIGRLVGYIKQMTPFIDYLQALKASHRTMQMAQRQTTVRPTPAPAQQTP